MIKFTNRNCDNIYEETCALHKFEFPIIIRKLSTTKIFVECYVSREELSQRSVGKAIFILWFAAR